MTTDLAQPQKGNYVTVMMYRHDGRGKQIQPATQLKGKYYAQRLDRSPTLTMTMLADLCGVTRQAVSKAVGLYREAAVRDAV